MSVTLARAEPSYCGGRRLHRADEAAGDVARGVHGARRHAGRARPHSSGDRLRGAAVHHRRRRRRRCAEHVVRCRHRRAHGAHRKPANSARPHHARRGAGLRLYACGVLGRMRFGLLVNLLAAVLLAFTIFFYVVIYTMWLKRSTPQNIVIGGAAGALPPMIGWAAATGSVALEPIVLFLIIFFWTPPHFWALSLYRSRRLRARWNSNAAGRCRRARNPAANPSLYADPECRLASRPGCSDIPGRSTAWPPSCSAPVCSSWRCECARSATA